MWRGVRKAGEVAYRNAVRPPGRNSLEEVSKLPAEGGQAQFAPKTTQIEPDPGSFETASNLLVLLINCCTAWLERTALRAVQAAGAQLYFLPKHLGEHHLLHGTYPAILLGQSWIGAR